jgi:DNA-directed RNA polymerase beta subunit
MKFGMCTFDDINHLKNNKIFCVANLIQDQFGLTLIRLKNMVKGIICGSTRH